MLLADCLWLIVENTDVFARRVCRLFSCLTISSILAPAVTIGRFEEKRFILGPQEDLLLLITSKSSHRNKKSKTGLLDLKTAILG